MVSVKNYNFSHGVSSMFQISIVFRSLHNSPAFHSREGDSDSEEEVLTDFKLSFYLFCNFSNFTFVVLLRLFRASLARKHLDRRR